jgi:hypothetical protein
LIDIISELSDRLPLLSVFSLIILFYLIEVKLLLAFGAEVIEVFDNPLPDTLLMKYVFTGQLNSLIHVIIADCAGQVMKIS